MHVNVGMSLQELLDPGSLMRRKIVGNDVDLFARRLIGHHLGEKGDEFLAGVTVTVLPSTAPLRVLKSHGLLAHTETCCSRRMRFYRQVDIRLCTRPRLRFGSPSQPVGGTRRCLQPNRRPRVVSWPQSPEPECQYSLAASSASVPHPETVNQ